MIGSKAPGTTVEVTIWRDNAEQKLSVKLDTLKSASNDNSNSNQQQQQQDNNGPVQSSIGLSLVPNSGGPGVLVQDVDPDSVAASKGFTVGDTILDVNKKKVSTPQEFQDAINSIKGSSNTPALIHFERQGHSLYVGLPTDGQ
jgi:serine protease Do